MKHKICAIIVTYNRSALCRQCVDAISSQTYACDLFVVNNHSSDDTQRYLTENNIPHFTTESNIGGAGGFYMGIRKAIEFGYEYLWLMDDDCLPETDALEKLMEADQKLHSDFGFLSSKVLWTDGNIHRMNEVHPIEQVYDSIYSLHEATFVSLLIKTETVKTVGLPVSDFFIWGDDIEYTRRIAVRYQIPSYYVENSIVIHQTANNIGSKLAYDEIKNIERYFYAYRNECYLYRMEGIKGRLYYAAKCVYNALRVLFLAKDHKARRLKILLQGIRAGLTFNPQIETLS